MPRNVTTYTITLVIANNLHPGTTADDVPFSCEGGSRVTCPTDPCTEGCLSDSVDVGCFVNDCEFRIVQGGLLVTTADCIAIYYDIATGNYPVDECYPTGEVPLFGKLTLNLIITSLVLQSLTWWVAFISMF